MVNHIGWAGPFVVLVRASSPSGSYVAADRGPSLSRSDVRAELATARAKNGLAHGEFS